MHVDNDEEVIPIMTERDNQVQLCKHPPTENSDVKALVFICGAKA